MNAGNVIDMGGVPPFAGPVNNPLDATPDGWKKIGDVAKKIFDFFEHVLWKYINETGKLAKRVFTIIATFMCDIQDKLINIVKRLGILSVISFLLAIKNTITDGISLKEHIKNRDAEGIVFSSISLLIDPLSAFDSAMTTAGALAAFGAIPTIAFFSLIALPVVFVLVGYGVVKGIYDLIRRGIELHFMPKSVQQMGEEELKKYIEKKIGITREERFKIDNTVAPDLRDREIEVLKARKMNILKRHTDTKVCKIMENLREHLKTENPDLNIADKALRDMRKIQARKIVIGSISTSLNLAFLVSLACSAVFPIAPLFMPILLAVKSLAAMGTHLFEHAWLDKGLEHPAFLA